MLYRFNVTIWFLVLLGGNIIGLCKTLLKITRPFLLSFGGASFKKDINEVF